MIEEQATRSSLKRELRIFNQNQEALIEFHDSGSYDVLKTGNNNSDSKKDFYNEFYDQDNLESSPLHETRNVQFFEILKRIRKLNISKNSDSSYIDIGAGQGHFVEFLRNNHQGKFVGVEPAINNDTEFLKKGKLEDITEQYDFVSLLDVFEHFENPDDTIQKIHKVVKEDGYICLKVPNKDSLLYRLAKSFSFIKVFSHKILWRLYQVDYPPPHYCYFNKSSLTKVIGKYFDVVETFYISEIPLKGIFSRLWGVNPIVKLFILPAAIIYSLITVHQLNDGLVVIARKKIN